MDRVYFSTIPTLVRHKQPLISTPNLFGGFCWCRTVLEGDKELMRQIRSLSRENCYCAFSRSMGFRQAPEPLFFECDCPRPKSPLIASKATIPAFASLPLSAAVTFAS
jgi:hypothetical protein